MTTRTNRPVYLNLFQIKLPIPGIASIGHRISGVVLILAIPFAAYLFAESLSGPSGFAQAVAVLNRGIIKLIIFLLVWGLLHHLFAGIRYLLLDIHVGIDKESARKSAWGVMIGAALVAIAGAGVLL
jgi:succinate dehydrogenase / fumarate reductase, cytochrome b subunit